MWAGRGPCCSPLLFFTVVSLGQAAIFTSSAKMALLASCERALLAAAAPPRVQTDVTVSPTVIPSGDEEDVSFMTSRRKMAESGSGDVMAFHPNGAYLLVKTFVHHWTGLLNRSDELGHVWNACRVEIPKQSDLQGTQAAILRLQRVYGLSPAHMYAGNYSDFLGPALSPMDAYAIGQEGFTDGFLNESVQWLSLAAEKIHGAIEDTAPGVRVGEVGWKSVFPASQQAAVLGLLGRAYIYLDEVEEAQAMYMRGLRHDANNGDLLQLKQEMVSRPGRGNVGKKEEISSTLQRLCSRPKTHIVEQVTPFHKCRYKSSLFWPYLRYKEEVLSLRPFVSLFYDVIHDDEIRVLQDRAKNEMAPGGIESEADDKYGTSYSRNSDVGWLHDDDVSTASRLSVRVEQMTWLRAHNYPNQEGTWTAEPLQVVNYGIGGHYNVHIDPITNLRGNHQLEEAGTRIGTFLIYLTDVVMGGHTVFTEAGISVSPVKGMALFWYNVDTTQETDHKTAHAGCPVVKGHKWVANKWIWTYGNTYRSPCGPRPSSTHSHVEKITYRRRHNIFYEQQSNQ